MQTTRNSGTIVRMADDNDDQFQTNSDDTNPMQDMEEDEKLDQDYGTPFSPPSGAQDRIDDTHPATDTNIDPHERYDEGIEGAAGIDLPGEAADEGEDPNNIETGDD